MIWIFLRWLPKRKLDTAQHDNADKRDRIAKSESEVREACTHESNVAEKIERQKDNIRHCLLKALLAAGDGAAAAAPAEVKTVFTVILIEGGANKVGVIKEVRAITNLDLKEAMELVHGASKIVKECVSKADAEDIKKKLTAAGATVEVRLSTAQIELGKTYKGIVRSIKEFGAFVECVPGKEGLVHISELADFRVNRVEDVCKLGDEIMVKCIGIDDKGKCRLSRRAALRS